MNKQTHKNKLKIILPIVAGIALLVASSAQAGGGGGGTDIGGGGDASESRVNEIRADILNWIESGGPTGLEFPEGIDLESYSSLMSRVLAPHAVVLSFVTTEQERWNTDPELTVSVSGQPKTCRGFYSNNDQRLHVLCNTERFAATSPSDQYRLIHHEYAALAGVERNIGASSDYSLSEQLTDFLESTTVLRLALTRRTAPTTISEAYFQDGELRHPTCNIRLRSDALTAFHLGDDRTAHEVRQKIGEYLEARGYHLDMTMTERERTEYDELPIARDVLTLLATHEHSNSIGGNRIYMYLLGTNEEVLDTLGNGRIGANGSVNSRRAFRKMRRMISDMPVCVSTQNDPSER